MTRLIPLGISDFRELRTGNYYFVDKSMLIADVIRTGSKVILLPRPRRFGKTINLSMLAYFFDRAEPDSARLFNGLAIREHEDVMAHQAGYPTIFITFKDVKFDDYDSCQVAIGQLMAMLFSAHKELITGLKLEDIYESMVRDILKGVAHTVTLQKSLGLLTELIHRATGVKPMVLIDEYDAPIHAGYHHGYYSDIIKFMRNLLSGAFKNNKHLEKGVLTGILRIAKESIFSGFNNPRVRTILDEEFSRHFGFTEPEISHILTYYDLEDRQGELRRWYNGYQFGSHTIYNPWSIMQYLTDAKLAGSRAEAYWVNTSDNRLIYDLVVGENAIQQEELEALLRGETVHKEIETNIVMEGMTSDTVWSLLTLSGYLKPRTLKMEGGRYLCDLAIPNLEVRSFYDKTIRDWLKHQTGANGLKPLLTALLAQNMDALAKHFSDMVKGVLSFHDTAGNEPERVYHAFLLGLLVDLRGSYQVLSNRESGFGRYDIIMIPEDTDQPGFVFEFKRIKQQTPEATAALALQQIIERDYATDLREAGVQTIRAIGVAVDGKHTRISSAVLSD